MGDYMEFQSEVSTRSLNLESIWTFYLESNLKFPSGVSIWSSYLESRSGVSIWSFNLESQPGASIWNLNLELTVSICVVRIWTLPGVTASLNQSGVSIWSFNLESQPGPVELQSGISILSFLESSWSSGLRSLYLELPVTRLSQCGGIPEGEEEI